MRLDKNAGFQVVNYFGVTGAVCCDDGRSNQHGFDHGAAKAFVGSWRNDDIHSGNPLSGGIAEAEEVNAIGDAFGGCSVHYDGLLPFVLAEKDGVGWLPEMPRGSGDY